jgi:hypothetical protein
LRAIRDIHHSLHLLIVLFFYFLGLFWLCFFLNINNWLFFDWFFCFGLFLNWLLRFDG